MKLPNGYSAVVEMEKLYDYVLNAEHPRGRHKARVFRSALGIGREHSFLLRDQLLKAAATADAEPSFQDDFGQRYVLDFPVEGPAGHGTVRSTWIIRDGESFPRLTSCFVL